MRAGIIGTGGIAKSHADAYRKSNVQITALMDSNREAADAMAATIDGARVFDSYQSLLDSGLVDMVSICTPPVAHEGPAVYALERGIHVLLEKPMAHDVASAKRIAAAAEASRAKLTIGFRHRCLPAVLKLRQVINEGTIGPIVFFHNTFCGPAFNMKDRWFSKKAIAGGGTLMDTSVHSIDLFRYLVGEVVEQKAVMARHLEGIDVEDASILIVKADNGAIGSLTASWVAGDGQAYIDITGEKGRVLYDYMKAAEVRLKRLGEKEWETIAVEPSAGFAEEVGIFLAAIRGEGELLCTAFDGLRAVEIIEANY